MSNELEVFQNTHTWDLVPLPLGTNLMSCKWIYKIKTKVDGSVEKYKARLVSCRFTQQPGIDSEETFAPVVKMRSIGELIALATIQKWPLYQMDVKNTLLNGYLTGIVYVQPPPCVDAPSGHIYGLQCAIYCLKLASQA